MTPETPAQFILASNSQARQKMLLDAGYVFDVCAADIDEENLKSSFIAKSFSPADLACFLANRKAEDVSRRFGSTYVIGADQTLEFQGVVVNKSDTLVELKNLLRSLSGSTHVLHSSAAIYKAGQPCLEHKDSVQLTMRQISDEELDHYIEVEGEHILSCVGGYRYEGPGIHLFEDVKGDYFTILGLPLLPVVCGLRDLGVKAYL